MGAGEAPRVGPRGEQGGGFTLGARIREQKASQSRFIHKSQHVCHQRRVGWLGGQLWKDVWPAVGWESTRGRSSEHHGLFSPHGFFPLQLDGPGGGRLA